MKDNLIIVFACAFAIVVTFIYCMVYQDSQIKQFVKKTECNYAAFDEKLKKKILYLNISCLQNRGYVLADMKSKVPLLLQISDVKAYKKYYADKKKALEKKLQKNAKGRKK